MRGCEFGAAGEPSLDSVLGVPRGTHTSTQGWKGRGEANKWEEGRRKGGRGPGRPVSACVSPSSSSSSSPQDCSVSGVTLPASCLGSGWRRPNVADCAGKGKTLVAPGGRDPTSERGLRGSLGRMTHTHTHHTHAHTRTHTHTHTIQSIIHSLTHAQESKLFIHAHRDHQKTLPLLLQLVSREGGVPR